MNIGLPEEIVRNLREAFANCECFRSNGALKNVFVDERVYHLRNHVSDSAPNVSQRVNSVISGLYESYSTANENALLSFVRIMCDQAPENSRLRDRLSALTDDLALHFDTISQNGEEAVVEPPGELLDSKMDVHELIKRIVSEHKDGNLLINGIISSVPNSRAASYLAMRGDKESLETDYWDSDSQEIALRCLFITYGAYDAIERVCNLNAIRHILEEEGVEISEQEEMASLVKKLLAHVDASQNRVSFEERDLMRMSLSMITPYHIRENARVMTRNRPKLKTVDEVLVQLDGIELALDETAHRGCFDRGRSQMLLEAAWDLVVELLSLSLAFFALAFQKVGADDLFPTSLEGMTFDEIVDRIEKLQGYFLVGVQPGDHKVWERLYEHTPYAESLERICRDPSPSLLADFRGDALRWLRDSFVSDIRYVNSTEMQNRIESLEHEIEEWRTNSRRAQNECWQKLGRPLPFGFMRFSGISPETLCDFSNVRDSLDQIRELVTHLIHTFVTPRIVTVLGQGYDTYDNRVVLCTESQEQVTFRDMEWVFLTRQKDYGLLDRYALLPASVGKDDLLVEPLLFPVAEINDWLTQTRSQ